MMKQKLYVERPEGASPICAGHVTLLSPDGGYLLGEMAELDGEVKTVAEVRSAYNTLLRRFADANLLKLTAEEDDEPGESEKDDGE